MPQATRATPPGPSLLGMARQMHAIRYNPLGFLGQLAQTYGDVVGLKVGRIDVVILFHPAAIHEVLVTQAGAYARGRAIKRLAYLIGESILTTDGEQHRRQRKQLQPVFAHRYVGSYAEIIARHANTFTHTWQEEQDLDLFPTMLDLTLTITGEALFGTNLSQETAAIRYAMTDAMQIFWNYATLPYGEMLLTLPLPGSRRFRALRTQLNHIIEQVIILRRTQPSPSHDFLELLLAAQDDNGNGMEDDEIRDEAMTFLLAGHETVGVALGWACYALAHHPEVLTKMQAELDTILQGRPPTEADLPRLVYTRQVLMESLRLYPPLYGITRRALAPHTIQGWHIPRGANVIVSPFLTQRDGRWWSDPLAFRPERWQEADPTRPKLAYFPFGAGPHVCIGEGLAWLMGTLILATIAQDWTWDSQQPPPPTFHPLVTLHPQEPLTIQLHRRQTAHHREHA